MGTDTGTETPGIGEGIAGEVIGDIDIILAGMTGIG
jgi:hypothetical protein